MEANAIDSHFFPPLQELEWAFVRSSGAGGQNVNKVNSKAELRWNILASTAPNAATKELLLRKLHSHVTQSGEIIVRSQVSRDQARNREDCMQKLRSLLRQALFRPKKRIPTRPTASAKKRRLDSKRAASEKKTARRYRGGFDGK